MNKYTLHSEASYEQIEQVLDSVSGMIKAHTGQHLAYNLDTAIQYPHQEGDFTVIGPECFVGDNDGQTVINWSGENYIPQTDYLALCEAVDHLFREHRANLPWFHALEIERALHSVREVHVHESSEVTLDDIERQVKAEIWNEPSVDNGLRSESPVSADDFTRLVQREKLLTESVVRWEVEQGGDPRHWTRSTFPHPLVTIDIDQHDNVIRVVALASAVYKIERVMKESPIVPNQPDLLFNYLKAVMETGTS